jgi:hypothetical protein
LPDLPNHISTPEAAKAIVLRLVKSRPSGRRAGVMMASFMA